MRTRWLLLVIGVLCVMVLGPASAMSQGSALDLVCGSATVDAVLSPGEWGEATKLAFTPFVGSGNRGLEGWLRLMNDETHLYLAAKVFPQPGTTIDTNHWDSVMYVAFTDEPNRLDDQWAADSCTPLPGEGVFMTHAWTDLNFFAFEGGSWFRPYYEAMGLQGLCTEQPLAGVEWDAALVGGDALVWEWGIDLNASELDKVGPGDCFRLAVQPGANACPQGADCGDPNNWLLGWAIWPDTLLDFQQYPDGFATVCLNPCEAEEEFVPEPGTILLTGSGLVSLAGYFGLRRRSSTESKP